MIQLIRGFKDILPSEISLWQKIEKESKKIFEDFGFTEIRLPILEKTELFARSIGDATDIVEKEMYTFPDRKGELLTLRPEATASVVRSYIQHKMYATDPVRKLYTIGPMFRRERPQKGRYRQFYQINAEVFGVASPYIDAQLIIMLDALLKRLNVTDIKAHVNSLGCPDCRPEFQEALKKIMADSSESLCSDCQRRREKNPLRVLDCKVPACREVMAGAPSMLDYLCPECREHFEVVTSCLDEYNVDYEIDKRLVRGLDYYTRTAFELQTGLLGAQSSVAGGGRYDGLIKALGGPEQPAIGFAIGFDRLVEVLSHNNEDLATWPDLFVVPLGGEAQKKAFEWVSDLNLAGIRAETDFSGRSLKALMKRAGNMNARYALIVGERELEEKSVVLRNMNTREQVNLPVDGLVETLRTKVGSGEQPDETV